MCAQRESGSQEMKAAWIFRDFREAGRTLCRSQRSPAGGPEEWSRVANGRCAARLALAVGPSNRHKGGDTHRATTDRLRRLL